MLFNSYAFIFAFLPIVLIGTFLIGKKSHVASLWWLSLASLSFYGLWNPRFVLLLLFSIVFNYAAAYWMTQQTKANKGQRNKYIATSAIVINLLILAYFKYTNFFIEIANDTFTTNFTLLNIILPLGISFFTFTQIAFVVDVLKGVVREYSFVRYLLFVTYFPHLLAGPVLHHSQMMPQFSNPNYYQINAQNIGLGFTIFVLGLAKKIFFADNFGNIADPVFAAAHDGQILTFFAAWVGALAYTLQLYFDFSGYTDMAIGLSLMFNIRLPLNFNSPYKATSVIDFWRRWHMTLSTFLRDYLYIPLGGNRHGNVRRQVNILATMLLGGLWHGAGWTFIVWGSLHGVYLLINHAWRAFKARLNVTDGPVHDLFGCALTFLAVVFAWVFFRASDLSSAKAVAGAMIGMNGIALPETLGGWLSPAATMTFGTAINFTGIFPSKLFTISNSIIMLQLSIGLFWIWALPNTHQLMNGYKIVWEDLRTATTRVETEHTLYRKWWSWKLTPSYAIGIGLLFFAIVIAMAGHRASPFLYYQF